jgi:hypothetical protein
MAFEHVNHLDAVGTLYQEACVRSYDAKRKGDEKEFEMWFETATAILRAWPDLVMKANEKRTEQPST